MNLCQKAVGANDGSKFPLRLALSFTASSWKTMSCNNVLLVTVAQKSVTNQLVRLLAKAIHGSVRSKQTYT